MLRQKKKTFFVAALIFLLFFLFYAAIILFKRIPLFNDEYFYYSALVYFLKEFKFLYFVNNVMLPLTGAILALPGFLLNGSISVVALRLSSAIFSALTAALLFKFLKENINLKAAFIGIVLFFFSKLNFYFSTIAYTEATFNFFQLLTFYFFFNLMSTKKIKYLSYLAIAIGLAILSRPTGLYLPFVCALLYYRSNERFISIKNLFFFLALLIPFFIMAWLTFLPFFTTARIGKVFTFGFFPLLLGGLEKIVSYNSFYILMPLLIFFFYPGLKNKKKDISNNISNMLTYSLAFIFVFLLLISIFSPNPDWGRHYFPIFPFLIILFALASSLALESKKIIVLICYAFIAIFVISNVVYFPAIPDPTNPSKDSSIIFLGNYALPNGCYSLNENWTFENKTIKNLPVFTEVDKISAGCRSFENSKNLSWLIFIQTTAWPQHIFIEETISKLNQTNKTGERVIEKAIYPCERLWAPWDQLHCNVKGIAAGKISVKIQRIPEANSGMGEVLLCNSAEIYDRNKKVIFEYLF